MQYYCRMSLLYLKMPWVLVHVFVNGAVYISISGKDGYYQLLTNIGKALLGHNSKTSKIIQKLH